MFGEACGCGRGVGFEGARRCGVDGARVIARPREEGTEPIPVRAMWSSPPQFRKRNGFTVLVQEVLRRDPRVKKVTMSRRMDGGSKSTEVLVQVGGCYILKRAATAYYAEDGEGHCAWTAVELEVRLECWEDQLCVAMDLPPVRSVERTGADPGATPMEGPVPMEV